MFQDPTSPQKADDLTGNIVFLVKEGALYSIVDREFVAFPQNSIEIDYLQDFEIRKDFSPAFVGGADIALFHGCFGRQMKNFMKN